MGKVVNKAELEEILGVSHTTLTEWQDQGLPILKKGARGEKNEYDVPAVIAWMVEREVQKRSRESQRDRLTRLQADAQELELLERKRELVPIGEIEPTWRGFVLSAAAFLSGQHSRLAGILEGTPGVEAKRQVLREEFAQFLTRLGTDGARIQGEVEALLARISEAEAADFLNRISGRADGAAHGRRDDGTANESPDAPGAGGSAPPGAGPAAEGPALGLG